MEEAVNDLVVAPFRDLVEKASTALKNAGADDGTDTEPMQKAAKSLMKEGERGLKRIEPLCRSHAQEFGSAFVRALKEDSRFSCQRPIEFTKFTDTTSRRNCTVADRAQ